jgi:hypothetical protein
MSRLFYKTFRRRDVHNVMRGLECDFDFDECLSFGSEFRYNGARMRTQLNMKKSVTSKTELIRRIKAARSEVNRLGVRSLGLFGSFAKE